jgi:hypothetical protein
MATMASARVSTRCAHCGTSLIFPEWSESANGETTHIWYCLVCGHEFETKDNTVEKTLTSAELVEEFLPNLLVA